MSACALLLAFGFLNARQSHASPAAGRTYFVSASGNDSNSGTSPQEAWATIARVNAASLGPGDTVDFAAGQIFGGNLLLGPEDAGAEGALVHINSSGTAPATILAGAGDAIRIENSHHIKIGNLRVTAEAQRRDAGGHGIVLVNSAGPLLKLQAVVIDKVEVSGFYWAGIAIYGDGDPNRGFEGVRITDADVHDNVYAGMWTGGAWTADPDVFAHKNIYVGHSRFHDNRGDRGVYEQTGNGVFLKQVDGGVIEHCLAYRNGADNRTPNGPVGIWALYSNDVTIQHNESFANRRGTGGDGGGFDLDGGMTNSVMQYNYSHDNEGAGFLLYQFADDTRPWRNNVVRYNISERDARSAWYSGITIHAGGTPLSGARVHNNTVYIEPTSDPATAALSLGGPLRDVRVFNNLFISRGGASLVSGDTSRATGVRLENNAYWAADADAAFLWAGLRYTSAHDWSAATGQERTASGGTLFAAGDPRVVSPGGAGTVGDTSRLNKLAAYRIAGDSPLIDRGAAPPADAVGSSSISGGLGPARHDFYGGPVPRGVCLDIGANESTAGGGGEEPTSPLPPAEVNLILNGGFEEGLAGWQDWGGTHLAGAADAHDGSAALKVSRRGGAGNYFDLEPSTVYIFEAWSRVDAPGSEGWVGVKITDADGRDVGPKCQITTTSYTQCRQEFTTPQSIRSAFAWVYRDSQSGWQLADEFRVYEKTGAATPTPTPNPARAEYYQIVARHSGKCLEADADGALVRQGDCDGGANQQWALEPLSDAFVRVRSRHSGKVLDVAGASVEDSASLIQYASHGGPNQQWGFESLGDGSYRVTARHSGKALDVAGGSAADSAAVIQYEWHGGGNQRWVLLRAAP